MYVTRHTNISDAELSDRLWELYDLAYDHIAAQDVTRETLFRHEFNEVLADSTYAKTVVHRPSGDVIAFSVIATDIAVTRYLSVPYFRRRFPEKMAGGKVHYVMWVVVHPDYQTGRAASELAKSGLVPEADEGALLVFDLPESNQPDEVGRGAELLYRLAKMVNDGDTTLESLGVSRYYAIDFAPQAAEPDGEFEFHDLESEVETSTQTT